MSEVSEGLFAEVAIFSAFDKTLHYTVPIELHDRVRAGARVLAPLGRREACGLILAFPATLPDLAAHIAYRPLLDVLDSAPVVPPDLLNLCRWISQYYLYPLGEVLQAALPSEIQSSPRTCFRLTEAGREAARPESASELIRLLDQARKASLDLFTGKASTLKHLLGELKALEKGGLIERFYEWQQPAGSAKKVKSIRLIAPPDIQQSKTNENLRSLIALLEEAGGYLPMRTVRQSIKNSDYWLRKLEQDGCLRVEEIEDVRESHFAQDLPFFDPPVLTPEQCEAMAAVLPFIEQSSFQPFVLHGVTGSGKTEIYLRLTEEALKQQKGALILAPEIALSTQMEALFRQRFGSLLGVWHSGLSSGVRYDQWRQVLAGKKPVILGVRSAVFMPVSRLGLIIVDEEHDGSYKQDDHLRYHARDVAVMRARTLGIPVLLGSATPSLQSIHNCRLERYRQISLPRRVLDRPQPELRIVDMRRESRRAKIISFALQQAMEEIIRDDEQALIFLNRRGFATFLLCTTCGSVLECLHCSVSLTYHQKDDILRCHYCGWERSVPERCSSCGHSSLAPHGFGTERVEEEVKRLFPGARCVRMDRDTISHARQLVERLNAVRNRQANVLIGTQMVAKGHDFPNLTLVGIVNADTALQLPDYRAGETTVQLLMQVAGRAGRGEKPGRVILQTYNPSHYTIESVLKMDYMGFCEKELESRSRLQYPPFTKLLRWLVTAVDEEVVRRAAWQLAEICRDVADRLRGVDRHVAILGPSPAPLARLNNRHRWQLFAKAWMNRDLQHLAEVVLGRIKKEPLLRRVQLAIDRDPMSSI
jgi:primosomal protein N' (replication factor Y)